MVCSICQDSLLRLASASNTSTSSAVARLQPAALNCGHVFHKACINRWISSNENHTCPLCTREHHGPALVLYIDADENESSSSTRNNNNNNSSSRPRKNNQRKTTASGSSLYKRAASQTMDADKLCECFDELGIKAPEQNYYSSYNEYCGELLDELVASTGQLVLKHEDDRGRLEFRINRLEGYLEEQQDEVDRLNKLAEAHKQHIAGLQTALQREKDLVDWYEERYGSDSTEDYGEDSDEDIHYY